MKHSVLRGFTTYYSDKDPTRQAEYVEALQRNLDSPLMEELYILHSSDDTLPFHSSKLRSVHVTGRPTFHQFFEIINKVSSGNDVNVVFNTDIYFDHSLSLCLNIGRNEVYSLNRWDVVSDHEIRLFAKYSTADVWVFRGKVRDTSMNYFLGQLGCDNKLLYDLRMAGYTILNPALSILSYHLHSSNIRGEYSDPSLNNRILAPYAYSIPTFLSFNDFARQLFTKGPWHVIKLLIVQRSIRFQYYYDSRNERIQHEHIVFGLKPFTSYRYWCNHDLRLNLSFFNKFRFNT